MKSKNYACMVFFISFNFVEIVLEVSVNQIHIQQYLLTIVETKYQFLLFLFPEVLTAQ